jgi:two-component system NtrC family sensor kinase
MLKTIAKGEAWSGELCNRRKNGDIYWVEATIVPTPTHDGNGYQYVSVHTEITAIKRAEEDLRATNEQLEIRVAERTAELVKKQEEQRKLIAELHAAQGQLLQSEKMASIGQLAAGVAHEINNPIGYVSSNLGTLEKYIRDILSLVETFESGEKDYLPGSNIPGKILALKEKLDLEFLKEDISSLMTESKDGITRVRKIVQDLKDFSHVDEAEWQWTNLHNGLDSTLNIVWNELKYKAEVVKEYGDLPEVECFSSQINQVFMNLLVNAAHAIETRGTITIRTGHEGEQAWVEISDTGKGISPEHINRIFDPFFTTKPVGQGTGLGLSLSYSIMQKHHGNIEVRSEQGKGTTFRVSLPIKQPDPTEARSDV